jgi:hypothetical protein
MLSLSCCPLERLRSEGFPQDGTSLKGVPDGGLGGNLAGKTRFNRVRCQGGGASRVLGQGPMAPLRSGTARATARRWAPAGVVATTAGAGWKGGSPSRGAGARPLLRAWGWGPRSALSRLQRLRVLGGRGRAPPCGVMGARPPCFFAWGGGAPGVLRSGSPPAPLLGDGARSPMRGCGGQGPLACSGGEGPRCIFSGGCAGDGARPHGSLLLLFA